MSKTRESVIRVLDHIDHAIENIEIAIQHMTGREFTQKEAAEFKEEAAVLKQTLNEFLIMVEWRARLK